MIIILSYAGGDPVHFANQRELEDTISSVYDKSQYRHIMYNESMIQPFIKENNQVFKHSRGGGYWLWKPYIIHLELAKMKESDILLYIDSGSHLLQPVDELLEMHKEDVIIFECLHITRKWTKRDLFQKLGADTPAIRDSNQIEAGFAIYRKSALPLVAEWLRLGCIPENITDSPSVSKNYDDFVEHRHDQSILDILVKQKKLASTIILPQYEKPHYVRHHKRRKIENFGNQSSPVILFLLLVLLVLLVASLFLRAN